MRSGHYPWRVLLGLLLVAAAVAFLGLTVARNWADLQAHSWEVHWPLLLLSIPALTAVFGWGVVVWKLVLDRFEHPPVSISTLLRIWFLSNLARYIPGKVWQFVGAAELGRSAGLSRVVLLTSMAVHMGFTLLAAALVSALTLVSLAPDGAAWVAPLAWLLATASLLLVHPTFLNAALRLVPRVLQRDLLQWQGRWRDGLLILAGMIVGWLLYGGAFWLFARSVTGLPASTMPALAGINALSFLAGYLFFVAPAGLGAREGAMAVLLRPYAAPGIAAVVAILSRLWTVAAELLGAGLVLAIAGFLDARRTPPAH